MSRLAALLVAALLLGACVSVPTSGPVVEGRPAGEQVPPPNVAVIPTGPRAGDSPVAIAEGFLSSMSSYQPGYPTARQFLTPKAAAEWRPESGIAVYGAGEGSRNVSATETGVQIAVALVGRVADDGSYTPTEEGSRLVLDLTMTSVGGEWRIDSPPDGLVMTEFDFTREFAAFASYFFDPDFEVLVPDLTYLPVSGNLPTLLVEELLDGPTEWLDPGVRSALGPGVSLVSGTVVQAGTVARVDLSSQVGSAPTEQRDRAAAQLVWTLRQAPGVGQVLVLADGRPVPLPGSDTGLVTADEYDLYDPAEVAAGGELFGVADGAVVRVDENGAAVAVAGPLGADGLFRSVGVSVDGARGAAVTTDGASVTRAELADAGMDQTVAVGADVRVPSFDRDGRVWLVDRGDSASRVLLLTDEPDPVVVPAGVLDEVRVDRLTVAPDGVRIAGVYQAEDGGRLLLALILPQADGSVAVSQVRDVPLDSVEAVDVAWASATALALLGSAGEGAQPYLVELSNAALSSRGQVDGAVSLAASPGQPLVLGTNQPIPDQDGREGPLLVRQDALQEWVPLVSAQAPTYPG